MISVVEDLVKQFVFSFIHQRGNLHKTNLTNATSYNSPDKVRNTVPVGNGGEAPLGLNPKPNDEPNPNPNCNPTTNPNDNPTHNRNYMALNYINYKSITTSLAIMPLGTPKLQPIH